MDNVAGIKGPLYLYFDKETFTPKALKELKEGNYQEAWAFYHGFKHRFIQILHILKTLHDNSNIGRKFDLDEGLSAEFHRLLSSLCYLVNSRSFREGKYYNFDITEISRKLGRTK